MSYRVKQSEICTEDNTRRISINLPKEKGFYRTFHKRINDKILLSYHEIYSQDDIRIDYADMNFCGLENSIYMALITDGVMKINTKNQNFIYESQKTTLHQASHIPKGSIELKANKFTKGLGFIVDKSILDELILDFNFNKNTMFSNNFSSPKSILLAKEILNSPFNGSLNEIYIQSKALEIVFLEISKMKKVKNEIIKFSEFDMIALNKAKDILENSCTFVSIEELSRKVCLNEFKLKFGFQKYFFQTPYQISLQSRLRYAKKLLITKDLNINEISKKIGFKYPQSFTNAFSRYFGILPKDMRKNKKLYM